MNVSRDDFVIAIRSAFLKKQTKQKFSLLSLILLSLIILILSNYNFKIVSLVKSSVNEIIYRGSYVISAPEKVFKNFNNGIKKHLKSFAITKNLREELNDFRSRDLSLKILEFENQKLREQLNDYLISNKLIFAKIIVDNNSPYLRSFIVNKGSKDRIKVGMIVLDQNYLVGKVIEVNFMTSRVLMLSDINSNIPITISPKNLQAIATGNGDNYARVNYLKKIHHKKINDDSIAYTSGTGGLIKSGIPVGKIVEVETEGSKEIMIDFFSDFTQLQYVSITSFRNINDVNDEENLTFNKDNENKTTVGNSDLISSNEKLNILLKEKEINQEIRQKIELENNELKKLISEIQKKLFKSQSIMDNQKQIIQNHKTNQDELDFLRLNLEHGTKCQKKRKLFSKEGYEIGSPEYKNCVLSKGLKVNE